jgi:hypothetical protein
MTPSLIIWLISVSLTLEIRLCESLISRSMPWVSDKTTNFSAPTAAATLPATVSALQLSFTPPVLDRAIGEITGTTSA